MAFLSVDKIGTCCKLVKDVGCDGSTKLSKWIAKNCEISCEKCGKNDHCKEPETCSDKSGKKCIAWAENGFCKTIKGLAENCAKSCGKCRGNGSSDDFLGSSDCHDISKQVDCAWLQNYWLASRWILCQYSKFKLNCRKSCGICECIDLFPSETCHSITQICHLPNIRENCKKTCGKC